MKNIAITIFIVLLTAVMVLYFVSFQVRETESVFVMRFGKPIRNIEQPGLYFKWPAPIDHHYKFDTRMRVLDAPAGETTTKGAIPIIVNTYVVWRIAEPLEFFNANSDGSLSEVAKKLRSQINDTQNKVIGLHEFGEFVNSDTSKIRFREIEREMESTLRAAVKAANYGIEIETLGIKQLAVSEQVSKDVFERMRAQRDSETAKLIAQGDALAAKIRTDAESKRTELLAAAEARAKAIQGRGDAEAAKYYEMLKDNPELAMFLRNVDALKVILAKKATYVVPTDIEPFILLEKIPEIKSDK